jgi:hypothetical protein
VIPRENGQFVQTSNQVPPRGDIARYEDAESEDGERMHMNQSTDPDSLNLQRGLSVQASAFGPGMEFIGGAWLVGRSCRAITGSLGDGWGGNSYAFTVVGAGWSRRSNCRYRSVQFTFQDDIGGEKKIVICNEIRGK